MTITFLGTGTSQGVPVIACTCDVCHSDDPHDKRLRTSALVVDSAGHNILIDIGPDFRAQMLHHQVSHLDAILITHAHRDHVGGIDDIRPFNWIQKSNMQVYANHAAIQSLTHDYHYIFEPHIYPGLPEVSLHDVTDARPFAVGTTVVTPIHGMHKDLPVLGYRIDDNDGSHLAYFCLPEALQVIEQCKPTQAFITHMSHEMGFHAAVQATLPPHVHLAYDNLTVDVRQRTPR